MLSKIDIATRTKFLTKSELLSSLTKNIGKDGVVVLHSGRCGSTALSSMLSQHKGLRVYGEIFNQKVSIRRLIDEDDLPGDMRSLKNIALSRVPIIEVKALSTQDLARTNLKLDQFIQIAKASGFRKFIVLKRNNTLCQITSFLSAIERGRYHYNSNESVPNVQITIEPENVGCMSSSLSILQHIQYVHAEYERMNELLSNEEVLHLIYENDIEDNPSVAYKKVIKFCGLDLRPSVPKLQKIAKQPLRKTINNWQEVVRHLSGTPYEWMLET